MEWQHWSFQYHSLWWNVEMFNVTFNFILTYLSPSPVRYKWLTQKHPTICYSYCLHSLIRRWITFIRLWTVKQVEDKQNIFSCLKCNYSFWFLKNIYFPFHLIFQQPCTTWHSQHIGWWCLSNDQARQVRDLLELCQKPPLLFDHFKSQESCNLIIITSFFSRWKLLESDDLQPRLVKV